MKRACRDHWEGSATCPERRYECTSFYFPAQRCLPGRQIPDSSPAVAAAKGGENPSAGAAKTSPSTATPPGAGPDGRPRSSRNLHGRKAAAKCLPVSARQCSERAASSRSPSSSGGGGASWDAAARGPRAGREPLTPGPRAVPPPARPLRPRAAGAASLGPWGFASCRAMGTLYTSRPQPRSAPRRGAQPSAPRSSPGISGHSPGAGGRGRRAARLARSSCRARGGLRGAAASPAQGRGPHGAAAGAGRDAHGACRPAPARPGCEGGTGAARGPHPGAGSCGLRGRGGEERALAAAGRARDPPSRRRLLPLRAALLARSGSGSSSGSGSRAESVTAAQSGASLTKKARSYRSGRGRRGRRARASPRGATARPPLSRAPPAPARRGTPRGRSRARRSGPGCGGGGRRQRGLTSPPPHFPASLPSRGGEMARRAPPAPKGGGVDGHGQRTEEASKLLSLDFGNPWQIGARALCCLFTASPPRGRRTPACPAYYP